MIFFLIIITSFSTAQECPRFGVIQKDIPCIQPSSWNPGICSDYNVTIYDDMDLIILNTTWYAYKPYCAFNLTGLEEPGTYCYNSSIEDGCITLEREDNMLAITISIGMIICFFFIMGYFNRNFKLKILSFGIGLIELIFSFSLLYAKELGTDISDLMRVNFYMLLFLGFGIGLISLILYVFDIVDLAKTIDDKKWSKEKWGK